MLYDRCTLFLTIDPTRSTPSSWNTNNWSHSEER